MAVHPHVKNSGVLLALLSVVAATVGDIQLAKGLKAAEHLNVESTILSPQIWFAVAILIGQLVLWLAALRRVELSVAVPLTSLNFILSDLLIPGQLQETVGTDQWLGAVLIVLGILLVVRDPDYQRR